MSTHSSDSIDARGTNDNPILSTFGGVPLGASYNYYLAVMAVACFLGVCGICGVDYLDVENLDVEGLRGGD